MDFCGEGIAALRVRLVNECCRSECGTAVFDDAALDLCLEGLVHTVAFETLRVVTRDRDQVDRESVQFLHEFASRGELVRPSADEDSIDPTFE